MPTRPLLFAIVIALLGARAAHAQPWTFDDQDTYWPLFGFHHYGGDVNRPAATPDRPYFHGDDAVPLNLRWRDMDEAQAELAAGSAAAEVIPVLPAPTAIARRPVRKHRTAVRHRNVCPPIKPAVAAR